jgi:hypothetical protein
VTTTQVAERPTTAAAAKPAVADEAWLGGVQEPGADRPAGVGQSASRPSAEQRREIARQVLAPYVPTTRKPQPGLRWPLILVEGEEYTGKSTLAFELSTSEMIGDTYVLAFGEDIDWLGEINDDVNILVHDGTWHQIMGCVAYVKEKAQEALKNGAKPVLFIVDSMTVIWQYLSDWAERRAMTAPKNAAKLLINPNDEVDVSTTFWNAANRRHRKLVTELVTMSAIVVVTARGGLVSEMDDNGNPTKRKIYRVLAQKELGFATTAWVRLSRDKYPQIAGLRRAGKAAIRVGGNSEPVEINPRGRWYKDVEFSLEWLLVRALQFDTATARTSTVIEGTATAEPEDPARVLTAEAHVPVDADEAPGKRTEDETVPAGQSVQE